MKGRSTCVLLSMLFFGMIVFGSTICHADTYHSVYDSAFDEAISRSDAYGGFENYNGLYSSNTGQSSNIGQESNGKTGV